MLVDKKPKNHRVVDQNQTEAQKLACVRQVQSKRESSLHHTNTLTLSVRKIVPSIFPIGHEFAPLFL